MKFIFMNIKQNKKIIINIYKMKKKRIRKINVFNPFDWYYLLLKLRFLHFFLIGGTGVLLNITITAIFAELIFGRELYFYAYLIGLSINLLYNFTFHTLFTFKTKNKHVSRFIYFILYNLIMSFFQALVIKTIVNLIGINYYLFVIVGTIGTFFIINFIISKLFLFKEK